MVSALVKKTSPHRAELALIEFGLKSKAVDFSKILAMIDGMVKVLGEEQKDDDTQKSYCDKEITKSEGEKADTEEAIATSEAAIEEMTDESATLADEIKKLQKKELTEEEKILAASGRSDMIATAAPEMIAGTTQTAFTQLYAQLHQHTAAAPPPPPPPATWDAYQKKDGK